MSYLEQLHGRARQANPERFAPNGEELRAYPGNGWDERLVAWRFGQGMAEARASTEDAREQAPASDGPPDPDEPDDLDDQDAPYGRVRGEA